MFSACYSRKTTNKIKCHTFLEGSENNDFFLVLITIEDINFLKLPFDEYFTR